MIARLLTQLEEAIAARVPAVLAAFRSGVAPQKTQRLLNRAGVGRNVELLSTLYSWHDGMDLNDPATMAGIFPGGAYYFSELKRASRTEMAMIHGSKSGLITRDIQIVFHFDQTDSKLVSYSVREVLTGP